MPIVLTNFGTYYPTNRSDYISINSMFSICAFEQMQYLVQQHFYCQPELVWSVLWLWKIQNLATASKRFQSNQCDVNQTIFGMPVNKKLEKRIFSIKLHDQHLRFVLSMF